MIHPPQVEGKFLTGNLGEFRKDPLAMYATFQAQHGKIVSYRLGPRRPIMISDAAAFQYILRDHATNFGKTVFYRKMRPLVGLGLLTSDGELWRKQRRLIQPSFHRPHMEEFAGVMIASTGRMLDKWAGQERVELSQEMMDLTMDVVARSLLGGDVGEEIDTVKDSITHGLGHLMHKFGALVDIPEKIPTPRNINFRRQMVGIERVVTKLIDRRRREPGKDLLSALLQARDEETGQAMDAGQLKDEVATMFLAGLETTATSLLWTLYLLDENPAALEKVKAEITSVLGTRQPSAADLSKLSYLGCIIQESLRLYPPAWWYGRTPIADDEFCGFHFPKGSLLTLIPALAHRNPEYWPNPLEFEPERFSPANAKNIVPYSYVPFAAGPRMCIGKDFAIIEMTLTLAMILQRFNVTRINREPLLAKAGVTLRPAGAVWVKLATAS